MLQEKLISWMITDEYYSVSEYNGPTWNLRKNAKNWKHHSTTARRADKLGIYSDGLYSQASTPQLIYIM